MMIEIGSNLFHTAVLSVLIWGVIRFFSILGGVAQAQKRVKPPAKPIEFTR